MGHHDGVGAAHSTILIFPHLSFFPPAKREMVSFGGLKKMRNKEDVMASKMREAELPDVMP
jgi:hypothetical protein